MDRNRALGKMGARDLRRANQLTAETFQSDGHWPAIEEDVRRE